MNAITIEASAFCDLLSRVVPFAGKDDTLPVLVAVELELVDGYLHAVATDRYRLGCARTKVSDDAEPWSFLLKLADAKQIVRLFSPVRKPRPPFPPEITLVREGAALRVSSKGVRLDGSTLSLTFTAVDGDYIKWRSLIPSGVPIEPAAVAVNAKYLADFQKAARANVAIRVTVFKADKPILVEAEDFVGLLMPVRVGGSTPLGFDVFTGNEIHIGVTIDPSFGVAAVAS